MGTQIPAKDLANELSSRVIGAAIEVHRHSHGILADEIFEVHEGD